MGTGIAEMSITFTPSQVFGLVLGICGMITAVAAAVAVIIKVVDHFKSPDRKRDQHIEEHERRLNDHDLQLKEHEKYLKSDKTSIDEIRQNTAHTNKVIIETLQALVEHARNGNNDKQLDDANQHMNEYLREGVTDK